MEEWFSSRRDQTHGLSVIDWVCRDIRNQRCILAAIFLVTVLPLGMTPRRCYSQAPPELLELLRNQPAETGQPRQTLPVPRVTSPLKPLPLVDNAADAKSNFPQPDGEGLISLSDRQQLDLQGLVRWLAEVKDLQVFDDGQLTASKPIQFYGQAKINLSEMFDLVQAILRTNNLAIVKAELKEWYRIVQLANARNFAPIGDADQFPKGEYVTAVFPLKHVAADAAADYLRKLLYGGNESAPSNIVTVLPERRLLIVTDLAGRLKKVKKLIFELDQPAVESDIVFYKAIYVEAEQLSKQVKEILDQTGRSTVPAAANNQRTSGKTDLNISADSRTNRVVLIGKQGRIDEAMKIIKQLDVQLGLKLRRYRFDHVPASRIDALIRQTFGGQESDAVKRIYQSSISGENKGTRDR